MDRRAFVAGLSAVLAAPLAAAAQPAPKIPRVGSLITGPRTDANAAVLSGPLAALGYVEGKTLIVERRYAEGRVDRLAALAGELVQLRADVIVVWGVEPLEAVRNATSRIPIVPRSLARRRPTRSGAISLDLQERILYAISSRTIAPPTSFTMCFTCGEYHC